jgi:hypothetical protein
LIDQIINKVNVYANFIFSDQKDIYYLYLVKFVAVIAKMKSFLVYLFVLIGVVYTIPAYSTGSGKYSSHSYSGHSSPAGTHSTGYYSASSHNNSSSHNSAAGKHYYNSNSKGSTGRVSTANHNSAASYGGHSSSGTGHNTINGSNIIGNSTYFKHSSSIDKGGASNSTSSSHRPYTAGNVKKPLSETTPAVSSKSKTKPGPYLPAAPTFLPNYGQ